MVFPSGDQRGLSSQCLPSVNGSTAPPKPASRKVWIPVSGSAGSVRLQRQSIVRQEKCETGREVGRTGNESSRCRFRCRHGQPAGNSQILPWWIARFLAISGSTSHQETNPNPSQERLAKRRERFFVAARLDHNIGLAPILSCRECMPGVRRRETTAKNSADCGRQPRSELPDHPPAISARVPICRRGFRKKPASYHPASRSVPPGFHSGRRNRWPDAGDTAADGVERKKPSPRMSGLPGKGQSFSIGRNREFRIQARASSQAFNRQPPQRSWFDRHLPQISGTCETCARNRSRFPMAPRKTCESDSPFHAATPAETSANCFATSEGQPLT